MVAQGLRSRSPCSSHLSMTVRASSGLTLLPRAGRALRFAVPAGWRRCIVKFRESSAAVIVRTSVILVALPDRYPNQSLLELGLLSSFAWRGCCCSLRVFGSISDTACQKESCRR